MQKNAKPAAAAVAAGQGTSRRPDCRHLLRGGGCPAGSAAVSLGRAYPVALLTGQRDWNFYLLWCMVALGGYLAKTLLYNLALSLSHKATFQILRDIRKMVLSQNAPAYPWETFWTPPADGSNRSW